MVCVAALIRIQTPAPETMSASGERINPPPLGAGEVLMWLDEETPLYMTFQLPGSGPEQGGSGP
jgi:hypothetical protein